MVEIIKASAGSGKTYTLAVKYIEYLMKAQTQYLTHGTGWVKNSHRRTLAITFTNNSTNEMKQRIVKALYEMRENRLQDYVNRIKQNIVRGVTDERIRTAAGMMLEDMLEDWQMVRVSTIDSFFNQVVNAFIRELGIDQTPTVDLDTDAIVEQAVDNMLNRLEETSPEGRALVKFLGSMMSESISDGKRWSIRPALVKIAKHTLTDTYRTNASETRQTPDKAENLKKSLRKRIDELTEEANAIWGEMEERIKSIDGATTNCIKAITNRKTDSKTLTKCLWDSNAWFNKKNKAAPDDGPWLTEKLQKVMGIEKGEELCTCKTIARSINYTGVIAELDREIEMVCRQNDTIMVSSANHLINEIVGNSSAPFIYEKTGLGTDHYMIDEFQDTSEKQWENFVPLITESNSMGKESLVVGDVKQSIYRWRNGDWRILEKGITETFPEQCDVMELDRNFRSKRGIVEFNNTLYEKVTERFAELMGGNLPTIYGNVRQSCAREKEGGGNVNVVIAEYKKEQFQEFAMRRIIGWFNDLKTKGELRGSAVLVRKNDEAQFVAGALAEAGIKFVSTESLLVANDICVMYIIAAMEYVLSDGGELPTKKMKSMQRCISDNCELDTELLESLRWLPLEQMTMAIVRRYSMDTLDGNAHRTFVFTLADIIRTWTRNNDGNVGRWLEYWEEKSKTACVPLPADDEAVKIMTIHKSKGLQFTNVALMMNSTSWECGYNSRFDKMLPVETPQQFSDHDVSHVFIDIYKNDVKCSAYEDKQTEEWEECCIDELNALYVATTRAENNMLIVGNKTKEKEMCHGNNYCMVNLLEKALEGWGEGITEIAKEEEEYDKKVADNDIKAREHGNAVELVEMPGQMNVRVPKSEEQEAGIEKHNWLASISYEDEVGDMDEEQRRIWEKVRSRKWFARHWETVWNEREFAYNGRTLRPDRVMFRGNEAVVVDWKFGQKSDKYAVQVRGYCSGLKALGYEVKGYIYYAETDEAEEVLML
ncbi:MAG: UvrD-helicase domain-containing protein [Paludibacteraceae bacterium]|nr:UvrD-helicase domain-containing protein [Paludibacteraceae bacterium]